MQPPRESQSAGDTPRTSEAALRFEEAWRSGQRPDLDDYLPADRPSPPGLLAELVQIDLSCRLQAGEPARVESYFERYPALAADPALAMGLITAEYRGRRQREPGLSHGSYLERFLQYGEQLLARLTSTDESWPDAPSGHLPDTVTAPLPPADPVSAEGTTLPVAPPVAGGQVSEIRDIDIRIGAPTPSLPGQPAAAGDGSRPRGGYPPVPGYEIVEVLGRGGMGIVYKARHLRLKRMVALKMLLVGAHAGSDLLARFRREAEAVARLRHPNIVQIYDIGEQNGLPFLCLEYVEGTNLARRLDTGPLDSREAAVLVETLARAMHHAHGQGIVHRDLKPANILLASDGTPRITDFGLAKQLDAAESQTSSGAILGTPAYMAPEQAFGYKKAVSPATDVYALGAILYHCLTGGPPFRADTPLETVMQVVSGELQPPTRLCADVPPELEAICVKCLQKESANRYTSAEALANNLARFLTGKPPVALPATVEPFASLAPRRDPKECPPDTSLVMMASPPESGPAWDGARICDVLERFEEAWCSGNRPKLDHYLPTNGPPPLALLAELVDSDLRRRLRAGEWVSVESYFERYPALVEDPTVAVNLIIVEYRCRRPREPWLFPESYLSRFPQYDGLLRDQFAHLSQSDT